MNNEELLKELGILVALDSPSGFEEPVIRYTRNKFEKMGYKVTQDVRGNIYAAKKGMNSNAPCVMVMAHGDEIGFIVTGITSDGFLRFAKLGGATDMVLPGGRVRVMSTTGSLEGTIGVKPGHILAGDEARRVPSVKEMYIDIGATSSEVVKSWGVEIGTPAVFSNEFVSTHNQDRIFGKALDDRAGILTVLIVAEALKSIKLFPTVVFSITVEEEVGLRGAEVASQHIQPDVVIAIDTSPAGGTPDLSPEELPLIIGKGPAIKVCEIHGLITHRPLRELFRKIAEQHKIPYQWIVDTAGKTDAASAQQAGAQIAAISLGIPRRYSHSAVEMIDLNDVKALITLIVKTLPELKSKGILLKK